MDTRATVRERSALLRILVRFPSPEVSEPLGLAVSITTSVSADRLSALTRLESLRFAKPLEADKKYRSYRGVQFVAGAGKMVAGSVFVFEGNNMIRVAGGVRFQCVPKALLNTLVSPGRTIAFTLPTPGRVIRVKQQHVAQTSVKDGIQKTVTRSSLAQEVIVPRKSKAKNPKLTSPET